MANANIHMKGYILHLLHESQSGLWDYEIANNVMKDYNVDKNKVFWSGEVRATLVDLFSGALIEHTEDKLDNGDHFGPDRVLNKYKLSSFGAERMRDTGLL